MSRQLLGGQGRVAAESPGLSAEADKASASAVEGGELAEYGGILPGDQRLPHRAVMMKLDPNIRYIGVRSGPAGYGGDLLSRLI